MPRSLPSPPRFVRLFSFFFCLGLFFRGKSRLTGVPSPLWARLIPDKEADWWSDRVKLLFVPGCTRNVRIIIKKYRKHTHTQSAGGSPSLIHVVSFYFPLRVGENAVTKCTPRVWQFKEKIHPQIVIRCLISSVCDVQFDGKVFRLSQFFPRRQLRVKCPYCLYLTSYLWEEE